MLDGGVEGQGGNVAGLKGPLSLSPVSVPLDELVELAAVDSELYCSTFLSGTFRQRGADGHRELWEAFDSPLFSRVNAQCFRGFGKTANFRAFMSKRIAYRISRTILYVGINQEKAVASVQWLRSQVERNKLWTSTYGLVQGRKWQEDQIEIRSTVTGDTSWIVAAGISSGLRGLNFDDYRPDLILVDDVVNEENSLTQDSRTKVEDLILGAVQGSLAPPTEEPNAKMIMGQTPIHREDVSMQAAESKAWKTIHFPCWSRETIDLPDELQRSSWEARFPTKYLQGLRQSFAETNKLSLWAREYECRLTTPENSSFRSDWLQFYDGDVPDGFSVIAVDPVPPPSENQIEKGLRGKDYECIMVVTKTGRGYFVREYFENRDADPLWTVAKIFELTRRYKVIRIAIEAVGYQRSLKNLVENEMRRTGQYFALSEVKAAKSKAVRITNTLAGLLAQGRIFARRSMTSLIRQVSEFPQVKHDDVLDALAIAVQDLGPNTVTLGMDEYGYLDESDYGPLQPVQRCP